MGAREWTATSLRTTSLMARRLARFVFSARGPRAPIPLFARGVESGAAFDTTAVADTMMDDGCALQERTRADSRQRRNHIAPADDGMARDASDDRD